MEGRKEGNCRLERGGMREKERRGLERRGGI
jgi:hypothetical protein